MAFIRHIKRGNNTYAYLVESYRKNGKVKQRSLEYLGKMSGTGGSGIVVPPKHKRSIKEARKRGAEFLAPLFSTLRDNIVSSFGENRGNKLFTLGLCEFLHPSPLNSVEETARGQGIGARGLSPPSLTKMLSDTVPGELHRFFRRMRCGERTVVFDITSLSCYGEEINSAEFGYNRDCLHLPQVNLCLAVNPNRTPAYFRMIRGSVPDVSTVEHTVDELRSLGYTDVHLVFDRGFYSADNIASLKGYEFTGALPKRLALFGDIVGNNLDMEHIGNVVSFGKEKIMVREIARNGIRYILVHNPKIKYEQQENFMERMLEIETKTKELSGKAAVREINEAMGAYAKYFEVGSNEINRNREAIQRAVDMMGKYIIFTNEQKSSWSDILDRYRSKDAAEKAFSVLKNSGFLTPIRVHSDESLTGKLLAAFIFYYIYSYIMDRTEFSYNEVRMLFDSMLEVEYHNGSKSCVELTKKHKKLLADLGINV